MGISLVWAKMQSQMQSLLIVAVKTNKWTSLRIGKPRTISYTKPTKKVTISHYFVCFIIMFNLFYLVICHVHFRDRQSWLRHDMFRCR